MSYVKLLLDTTTLPTALLPIAKEQLNVDFVDDDPKITRFIAWAIGYLEVDSGLKVFKEQLDWWPTVPSSWAYACMQCPVQPVSSFIAMSGVTNVSADYELRVSIDPLLPVYLCRKDGTPFQADLQINLTVGIEDPADLPPIMEAYIIRVAATLYENRELITSLNLDSVPEWLNNRLTGLWVARA